MNTPVRTAIVAGGVTALIGLSLGLLLALPMRFGFRAGSGPDPIGLILGLLATLPLLTPFVCGGFALMPFLAGTSYAVSVARTEGPSPSVWGGALAGGFGGLVYGVLSGATSALIQSGAAAFLQDVEVVPATLGSGIGLSVSVGATIVGGVIFGALGSGAYSMWQRRKQAQSLSRGASILLGGCATVVFSCAVIFSCALLALSADAAYWSNRRGNGPLAQEVAPSASGASESELDRLRAGLEALPAGNAESGEQVLASNACHACHSLEAGVRLVGPSLAGIGTTAATRKQGYPAELYLYESLVYPEAFAVEGYPSGLMPAEVVKQLSQQQLADLIAFLMTQ